MRKLDAPPDDLFGHGAHQELLAQQSYGGVPGAFAPLAVDRPALPPIGFPLVELNELGGVGRKVDEAFVSKILPETLAAERVHWTW